VIHFWIETKSQI